MSSEITQNQADYRLWLGELKSRFRQVQLKAAVAVNTALLQFYWELGADIVARQAKADWGSGFLNQPTIGLLLCKSKDRLVAEYVLSDVQKPMGLATYTLSHTLPAALSDKLPSIEAIERELGLEDAAEAGGLGYEF